MAKSPQFPCYARDLLVDTDHLTAEQFGAYWRLLCRSWFGIAGGEPCYLPDNDAALAKAAGMPVKRWLVVGGDIRALLKKAEDGRLYSKRLLEELGKQQARSEKAKRSVAQREFRPVDEAQSDDWTESGIGTEVQDQSKANPRGCVLVADANSQAVAIGLEQQSFSEFWNNYPSKVGKLAARRAWAKTAKIRPPLAEILAAVERAKATPNWRNGEYIPNPATWLNQGRWDDQPAQRNGNGKAQFPLDTRPPVPEPTEAERLAFHREQALATLSATYGFAGSADDLASRLPPAKKAELRAAIESAPTVQALEAAWRATVPVFYA